LPDISKCDGKNCPLKETCYRYTSIPSEFMQAWFSKAPYGEEKKEGCEYYWDDEEYKLNK